MEKLSHDYRQTLPENFLSKLEGCYRENLCLCCDESFLASVRENSHFESMETVKKVGIIVKSAPMRQLPTDFPCFDDPLSPGQGYPFDNLQNSFIFWGTPVWISHFSKDKAWAFIEAPDESAGFVKIDEISILSGEQIQSLVNANLGLVLLDDVALRDSDGRFVTYTKMGMPLWICGEIGDNYQVFQPNRCDCGGPKWKTFLVSKDIVSVKPIVLGPQNLIRILGPLLGKTYGWGGYLGNRDCSALMKDYFSLCGLALKRNSKQQSESDFGIKFDLKNDSLEQKKKIILEKGLPFRTLLYCKGHIGLYVGSFNDQPIMLHCLWGNGILEAGLKGRNITGKIVLTTLDFGKDLPLIDSETLFLKKLERMIVF